MAPARQAVISKSIKSKLPRLRNLNKKVSWAGSETQFFSREDPRLKISGSSSLSSWLVKHARAQDDAVLDHQIAAFMREDRASPS